MAARRALTGPRGGERGFTLIPVVFASAMLLTAIAVAYLDSCTGTYALAQFRSDKARSCYLAEGALEQAVGALEDGDVAGEVSHKVALSEGEASYVLSPQAGSPGRYEAQASGRPERPLTARPTLTRIHAVLQVSAGPDGRRKVAVVSRDQLQ